MSNMNLYNSLLAGKLADGSDFSPSTAQLAAMNSGIDSTKVEQIATNASNITSLSKRSSISGGSSAYSILRLSGSEIPSGSRGAFLVSITYQTASYAPCLYYVLFGGEFLSAIEISGAQSPIVTDVTVKNGSIYFTCAAATWTRPVVIPLFNENLTPTISIDWVNAIPE